MSNKELLDEYHVLTFLKNTVYLFDFYTAFEHKTYEMAGKIMDYAIVHHCSRPRFFSDSLYSVLTSGYPGAQHQLCDVADPNLRQTLETVS